MSRLWIVLCSCVVLMYAGICNADTLDTTAGDVKPDQATAAKPDQAKTFNVKADEASVGFGNSKVSGAIFLSEGEVENGFATSDVGFFQHAWIQQVTGILRLDTKFNELTRMVFSGEGDYKFTYNVPMADWDKSFVEGRKVGTYNFWLKEAKGIFKIGGSDAETFPLQLDLGLFEYKYNPDVRNLGEYLFRASAYPVFFVNWFDGAFYRMAGLKATTHPVDWFNFDAMLFSELYQLPLQDFSVAGVATFNIGRVGQFGAGIDFNRLFSVDGMHTTPSSGAGGSITDNIYSQDSIGADANNAPIYGNPKYYTFQSTKVAFRGSFDIKGFFDWPIFGPEDFKLYSEAAILGLKNYVPHNPGLPGTSYYANMSQRCPVMVGFNFPGFKILDVLSIELEYLKTPFIPSSQNVFKNGTPTPIYASSSGVSIQDTKWSFYLKKRLGAFMVVAQAARDHYLPFSTDVATDERSDVMIQGKDWWWTLKLQYGY
jgi:hypothetical protein